MNQFVYPKYHVAEKGDRFRYYTNQRVYVVTRVICYPGGIMYKLHCPTNVGRKYLKNMLAEDYWVRVHSEDV